MIPLQDQKKNDNNERRRAQMTAHSETFVKVNENKVEHKGGADGTIQKGKTKQDNVLEEKLCKQKLSVKTKEELKRNEKISKKDMHESAKEDFYRSQSTQLLTISTKEPNLLLLPKGSAEDFIADSTQDTLTSDRTQQFSDRSMLEETSDISKSSSNVVKRAEDLGTSSETVRVTVSMTKVESPSEATSEATSSKTKSIMKTTSSGDDDVSSVGNGQHTADLSQLSSNQDSTTETHPSITSRRIARHLSNGSIRDETSKSDFEKTRSSKRVTNRRERQCDSRNQSNKHVPLRTQQLRLSRLQSFNVNPTKRPLVWTQPQQRKPIMIASKDQYTLQKTQCSQDTTTSRSPTIQPKRLLKRQTKLSSGTESTEESSKSRNIQVRPRRIPIKVNPVRLKIPVKRNPKS
ncbi:unnamed protein product [Anisakis simplex]|uniref:Shugoshin_C domain-containing protein n=1 Tax=Anisakis simplex TaxID=6269 RepID=A0A0M3JVU9_ANISI|nr:unnamed protein product [Anisakis simplex]